jgi:diadenosine tetraphosphatase ApaH/serine/threonine PP2A family protein phosphatase
MNFVSPDEIGYQYQFGSEKAMVNVGSVGQPRDGDPRACYVVQEDGKIT